METILRLYFTDTPVNETGTYTLSQMDALSKAADIKTGGAVNIPYATFEPDYWLLDGTFNFVPTNAADAHIGVMSTNLTNEMGQYGDSANAGWMNIAFAEARDVDKITLQGFRATGDYASKVRVRYFRNHLPVAEYTATPGNINYTFSNPVADVEEVRFILLETNKPNRRARLTNVFFDDIAEFRGEMVQTAKIVKESSLLSTELPYGTLTATLIADDSTTFDMTSSNSLYGQLEDRLAIDVLLDNGRTLKFIGRYYLTDWKSPNAYQLQIEAMDVIGLLEDIPYNGDHWITNELFSVVLNRILSFVPEIKMVTIENGFTPPTLRGFLKNGNIREALQQVLFAGGASFEIINGTEFHIFAQKSQNVSGTLDGEFTTATKALDNQSLTIKPAVTRLELYSHDYQSQTTEAVIADFTSLPLGIHMIYFEKPVAGVVVEGSAALVEYTPSYAKINVTGTGTIKIRGGQFIDNKVLKAVDIASAANKPNVVKIEDTTIVPSSLADSVVYRMQVFFAQKFQQEWRAFNPDILDVNRLVSVATINNKKFTGVIERAEIDLTSGGIVDYTATGIVLDAGVSGTKSIIVGSFGTVGPPYFYYPSTTPQTFTVALKDAYKNDYGIEISINGVKTLYVQDSVSFTLPSTNQLTEVAIGFPLASKPITVGSGMTVTPARFKYPVAATQYFDVINTAADAWKYFIRVKIDATATDYDIAQKVFALENTTSAMTVEVTRVEKSTKQIIINGDPIGGFVRTFYYPVAGTQALSYTASAFHDGAWGECERADYRWYINDVLKSTQLGISTTTFNLSNATAQTVVRLEISNVIAPSGYPGGGGSGSGGGTGYETWTAFIYGNSILRDAPSESGNFIASFGWGDNQMLITSGSGGWYYGTITKNAVYPQLVGLSGYIASSNVSNPR